jgi:hypothetical protein
MLDLFAKLARHRSALIRAHQQINGCHRTGVRCRASEDCQCVQDYEMAIRPEARV